MSTPHPSLPLKAGIGLKPAHYAAVLSARDDAHPAWMEVHPQNYFGEGGPPHRWLSAIAERYPLSFHSVGLSIGSADGVDPDELDALATLVDRYQPAMVSDHLSWSVAGSDRFPDLLPLPYRTDSLSHVCAIIGRVQDRLKRQILIENPSRYLSFAGDQMDEPTFMNLMCERTGCGILLDVNNIVVSAENLGQSALLALDGYLGRHIGEVHLAGHSTEHHDGFTLHIDDHGSPVSAGCWQLFVRLIDRIGPRPTLIEWDSDVPDHATLCAEAAVAQSILDMNGVAHALAS